MARKGAGAGSPAAAWFGLLIRTLRLGRGLTARQLVKKAGISLALLGYGEAGLRDLRRHRQELAQALDVPQLLLMGAARRRPTGQPSDLSENSEAVEEELAAEGIGERQFAELGSLLVVGLPKLLAYPPARFVRDARGFHRDSAVSVQERNSTGRRQSEGTLP